MNSKLSLVDSLTDSLNQIIFLTKDSVLSDMGDYREESDIGFILEKLSLLRCTPRP